MEARNKEKDAKDTYHKARDAANDVIALHPILTSWSVVQLKTIIAPLKTKNDGAMPTLKKKMLEAYKAWKDRPPPSFTIEPELVVERPVFLEIEEEEEEDNLMTNEEEAIAAMMDLGATAEI